MDIGELLFPKKCVCCGTAISNGFDRQYPDICASCEKEVMRVNPPYCPICLRGKDSCRCYNKQPFVFDCLISPFYYEGAIRDAIMRMKFEKKESVSVFLGRELGDEIRMRCFGYPVDIITCVPASNESLANRGFNQSRSIAENLNLPIDFFPFATFDFSLLVKKKSGIPQHYLGAQGRLKNITGSFELNKNRNVVGKTVLLVDDIVTTGATAGECTKVLKFAGADKVLLATSALTRYN